MEGATEEPSTSCPTRTPLFMDTEVETQATATSPQPQMSNPRWAAEIRE